MPAPKSKRGSMQSERAKRGSMTSGPSRRKSAQSDTYANDDDYDVELDLQPPTEVSRVPESQVQGLTEEELSEVFTKVLTAGDPNVSKAIVEYDHLEGTYSRNTTIDNVAVHFVMDSSLIVADGPEAKSQERFKEMLANKELMLKSTTGTSTNEDDNGDYPSVALDGNMQLKNQFNFSERASQTFNPPKREKEISTEPPPTTEYSGTVCNWAIYDAYLSEIELRSQAAALQEQKKPVLGKKKQDGEEQNVEMVNMADGDGALVAEQKQQQLSRALKIMERIVHTNAEADCFQEYKFFEDKSENKREDGRGSFLPLWRFAYEKSHRKTVTGISWNPQFTDLFAVGYGSYDFNKQAGGLICCFSLKNTSYPEFVFETESGVMTLDFHPIHSSLLCVGLYDGTVAVYDVRSKGGAPIYRATDPKLRHRDPVWQVYWSRTPTVDELSVTGEENIFFYSVSSDGRVTKWRLSKTDLLHEDVVSLKLTRSAEAEETGTGEEGSTFGGLAGGSCFDFDKGPEHLFVVGTEEGAIQSYSQEHNAQLMRSFEGHFMAVYSVKLNPFHPDVFLSCSADWTVKLWHRDVTRPVMSFDLNTSVGDVAWAPFSSTVFAVITTDGKLRVYDLNVNKHEPIGETKVHKKAKLTHLSFNPTEPVLCVGDDRGVVTILKLSSNLRKMTAPKLELISTEEEVQKLNKVMIVPEEEDLVDVNAVLSKMTADNAPQAEAIKAEPATAAED